MDSCWFRGRKLRASVLLLCLLQFSGCSSWNRIEPISASSFTENGVSSKVRVLTNDGRMVTVHDPRVDPDSLRGRCARASQAQTGLLFGDAANDSCTFAYSDIRSAEVKRPEVLGTVLLLACPLALLVGLYALARQD